MRRLAVAAGALVLQGRGGTLAGQDTSTTPTHDELAKLAKLTSLFMADHGLPGLAVTVARQGRVVYQNAAGFADPERRESLATGHLFRIASVSKPVTAVAVLALAEQDRLKLDDRVFGSNGLLGNDYGKEPSAAVAKISVRHLLTHTCGGWGNARQDPMFLKPGLNHHDLIAWTLREQPLEHEPGTRHAYSNFGYCVLGRVIERLTGRPYAEHVRQTVLAKCGIAAMRIAGNTRDDRAPNEVVYVDASREAPYRMNVARMDAHGGWLGSTGDLVKFASRVDGFDPPADILRPETLGTMTATNAVSPNYGCGWAVNRAPNWWHNGSLPGTTTLLVRTASGLCWAAFANTRTKTSGIALDRFMWDLVRSVPAWRA